MKFVVKKKKCLVLLLWALLLATSLPAQDSSTLRQLMEEAEQDYRIGRLEQALQLLTPNAQQMSAGLRQSAYRLMALCYLAQDDIQHTEEYAMKLLGENPYYTSTVLDPVRFGEIIERLKTGQGATVTTASSHAESINEAPVPVTIITREMIDNMGYGKDLNALLAALVPGISEVSTYAMNNVAMHGVYTVGQEKILIMENGHRLNARSTNNGRLEYAVSTEKIDHIEVLRGPASSLYGNVALTAVVNIITRKGSNIDGVKGRYGYGSYGTHKADLVAGTRLMGADVLTWGSVYASSGKDIMIPAGTGYTNTNHDSYAHIGSYEGRPSYDLGCNLQIKDFSLMFNRRSSKRVPPYSWYGETYDYDRYRRLNGHTPGYTIDETHLDLGFRHKVNWLNLDVSVYGDWMKFYDYAVVSDSMVQYTFKPDGTPDTEHTKVWIGTSQDTYWDEYTLGAIAKADASYNLGTMHGNLLVGAQFERFAIYDTYSLIGQHYETISSFLSESNNYIRTGHERSISLFLQDKHYLTRQFILNAGLRYDAKYRLGDTRIRAYSPRFAFIYALRESFNAKISYARSFVDAPYFYRQNIAPAYAGSQDLMPEYMNAWQLNFIGTLQRYHLTYDFNLFYNHLTDIISNTQNTGASTAKYHNSGSLKTAGAELELIYSAQPWYARLTASWLHLLSAEDYTTADAHIYSIPDWIVNLHANRRLFSVAGHTLNASANVRYSSQTLERVHERRRVGYPDFYEKAHAIVDLGLKYCPPALWGLSDRWMQLSLDCSNLLNTQYDLGGTTYFPYQTLGRTLMASVSFKL